MLTKKNKLYLKFTSVIMTSTVMFAGIDNIQDKLLYLVSHMENTVITNVLSVFVSIIAYLLIGTIILNGAVAMTGISTQIDKLES